MLRSHTCGELGKKDIDKSVELSGWVHSRRDHGGIIFIDLRDRYGLTQLVFDPNLDKKAHSVAEHLRREDVIHTKGKVRARGPNLENPKLKTGEIEVVSNFIEVLTKAETPPLEVDDRIESSEDIRLKYRYLDLRRPKMQQQLIFRHKCAQAARNYLSSQSFIEFETPLLMKATPEGARDYVVPSRVNPGKFYALPQSPQLYKQLLMVSGMDKYFQIAKCLRDEDLRADRQPEFTQIDVEMSFGEQDDIFKIGEGLVKSMFNETMGKELKTPFLRLPYKESMDKYGCDKPDLRFGLELKDVTSIVIKSDFGVFKDVKNNNGIIKCINPQKDFARNDLDSYIAFCTEAGAKGMAWMRVTEKGLESNIAKYFKEDVQKELMSFVGAKPGSVLMFIADKPKKCNEILAKLRNKLGADLNLYDKNEFKFCWIIDFPLFELDEETDSWMAAHHMFTMPKKECLPYLESDPGKVYASCYDMVLNGVELASGSIRIHDPQIQERVMKIVGFPKEKAHERFGFLLEAFKYGAPPHGGFAIGFDRFVAMLQGFSDIREVIAFPKNKAAECPMDGCPSNIEDLQLKELNIKIDAAKKK
jgi:aspartyl-tRNA synthetase